MKNRTLQSVFSFENNCSVISYSQIQIWTNEPPHDKTYKMTYAPSEDSDQPGHLPSYIIVFAGCMKNHWAFYLLSAQWRLIRLGGCPGWSESSLGAHYFVGVVVWWLKCFEWREKILFQLIGLNFVPTCIYMKMWERYFTCLNFYTCIAFLSV